jgi:hypothetical protein
MMASYVPDGKIATTANTRHFNDIELDFTALYHGEGCDQASTCDGGESGESDDPCQHPNIKSYMGLIRLRGQDESIGHLRMHIFDKLATDSVDRNQMRQESQAYDTSHWGGMMNRVENFIANEEFWSARERSIEEAHAIVFIEEVWLRAKDRGRDRGLHALHMALSQIGLTKNTVVLLQAGSVGEVQTNVADADQRLTVHWKRLGLEPWSPSDDSWLCLSLKDETYGLAAMHPRCE